MTQLRGVNQEIEGRSGGEGGEKAQGSSVKRGRKDATALFHCVGQSGRRARWLASFEVLERWGAGGWGEELSGYSSWPPWPPGWAEWGWTEAWPASGTDAAGDKRDTRPPEFPRPSLSLSLSPFWFSHARLNPYLQQLPARATLLHVHLQTAGQEGLEDGGELLRTLQLRSPVGGD